jgi:hypothetical protein
MSCKSGNHDSRFGSPDWGWPPGLGTRDPEFRGLAHRAVWLAWPPAGLAAVSGFLYVVPRLQDLSPLVGTVGLFLVLAIVMYVTRNID